MDITNLDKDTVLNAVGTIMYHALPHMMEKPKIKLKDYLIEKYNDKGMSQHTTWIYEYAGRKIGIDHNHDCGFYIFEGDMGHGEDCNTVWYDTLRQARKEVKHLFSSGKTIQDGRSFCVCNNCKCHFIINSESDGRKDFACDELKKEYAAREIK